MPNKLIRIKYSLSGLLATTTPYHHVRLISLERSVICFSLGGDVGGDAKMGNMHMVAKHYEAKTHYCFVYGPLHDAYVDVVRSLVGWFLFLPCVAFTFIKLCAALLS